MAGIPEKIQTWQMTQTTSRDQETKEVTPGKLENVSWPNTKNSFNKMRR
jgi:hypothetical protein